MINVKVDDVFDSIDKELKFLASLSYDERVKWAKENLRNYDPMWDELYAIGDVLNNTLTLKGEEYGTSEDSSNNSVSLSTIQNTSRQI